MGNALLAFGTDVGWIVANPHSALFVGIGIALILGGAMELCASAEGGGDARRDFGAHGRRRAPA
jgi:hypothetical protein